MRSLPAGDGVRLLRDVRIPMRDGVSLAADLYVPDEPTGPDGLPTAARPVVMDYLPYRKDEVDPAAMRHYRELPRHGYVVARVDIRGTGGSGGHTTDEYLPIEQRDGYDAIEWMASQPWCDGHVSMLGISYGGFAALQVATLQPPHLTSIVAVDFTDDRYTDDCHYRGGLARLYYDLAWYGTRMIAWNAMPTDPAFGADGSRERWRRHVDEDEPYLLEWLRHQVDGPYWRQGSVADAVERIACPAFLIGGWRDGYPNPPTRLFERLAGPKKLLVGPWDHRYPDNAIPGPRIDHLVEVVRWLDHWCLGRDTGIMDEPAVALYVQDPAPSTPDRLDTPGRWRAEAAWPPAGAAERTLALGPDGRLVAEDAAGDAAGVGIDRVPADPLVGTTAGLWSGGVPFGAMPADQGPDEARSLVYTSAPLERPLTILGRARAILHVVPDGEVVGVAVALADVDPDGRSHLVAKGMLNGTRRSSWVAPEPMIPGELHELTIEVDATGWRFPAGHRVRLAIATADWPNVWPAPSLASVAIHRGPDASSRLVLPTVPDEGPLPAPAFRPSPVDVRPAARLDPMPTWVIAHDLATGRASATIGLVTRHATPDGASIERDAGCVCELDPARPGSATARGWHHATNDRDGHRAEGRADVAVAADPDAFHVTIDLEIAIDGVVEATRRWDERIPRILL